jgi:hypothetical protein
MSSFLWPIFNLAKSLLSPYLPRQQQQNLLPRPRLIPHRLATHSLNRFAHDGKSMPKCLRSRQTDESVVRNILSFASAGMPCNPQSRAAHNPERFRQI